MFHSYAWMTRNSYVEAFSYARYTLPVFTAVNTAREHQRHIFGHP